MISALDPVTLNSWYPALKADALNAGEHKPARLFDHDFIIWRSGDGLRAFEDRCPHRGTRLSLSDRTCVNVLSCPYHGWEFDASGACTAMPAQPGGVAIGNVALNAVKVTEAYGLAWLCLGPEPADEPEFDGVDAQFALAISGPHSVAAAGPRIIENFLDMSHFPFVHQGYLGDDVSAQVPNYKVYVDDAGVHVRDLVVTQPKANLLANTPQDIRYTYDVIAPLQAILTKVEHLPDPPQPKRPDDIIAMLVQPVSEDSSVAWTVLARSYGLEQDEADFISFQDTIFLQDKAILESQQPKPLPLNLAQEKHQTCDKVSLAYRRWLSKQGVTFGVSL
ncbi:MAG: aromatic ring-hydroxylating dioxygenase subunit alpha [Pseudomonadota bacterium]